MTEITNDELNNIAEIIRQLYKDTDNIANQIVTQYPQYQISWTTGPHGATFIHLTTPELNKLAYQDIKNHKESDPKIEP